MTMIYRIVHSVRSFVLVIDVKIERNYFILTAIIQNKIYVVYTMENHLKILISY